jgi:hypothetical protein
LAAAGLVLAPLAASADLNKCSKDIQKNGTKIAADVVKELDKCVQGILKDLDKGEANRAKGKVDFDIPEAGMLKAVSKCEAGMAKVGLVGIDIACGNAISATVGDNSGATCNAFVDAKGKTGSELIPKSKVGKGYGKLVGATNADGAGKEKCGLKDPVAAGFATKADSIDAELLALGLLPVQGFDDVGARVITSAMVGQGLDVLHSGNGLAMNALAEAGNARCSISGQSCDDDTDCVNPNKDGGVDVCETTLCPSCLALARAVDGPVLTIGAGTVCSPLSGNPLAPCADEATCGGQAGVTDFCDTTPSSGNHVGPCFGSICDTDGSVGTSLEAVLNTGALDPNSGLPVLLYQSDDLFPNLGESDDDNIIVPINLVVTITGRQASQSCNIPEILPGGIAVNGGPSRGLTAGLLVAGNPIDVCVDGTRSHGYYDLGGTLPAVDVESCTDSDSSTSDECSAFTLCTENEIDTVVITVPSVGPIPVVPAHESKSCIAITPAAGGPGSGVTNSASRITTGSCFDVPLAVGGSSSNILTTGSYTGTHHNVGPDAASATNITLEPGTYTFTNAGTGAAVPLLNLPALASFGDATGATLVGTFGAAPTDAGGAFGASLTGTSVICQ